MRFVFVVSLLLTACCGFHNVNGDGGAGDMAVGGAGDMAGGGGSGGGGGGGSGGGGGGGGGGGTSMCTGCGCGSPVLLVAVQSVNGATGSSGRVLQLSVPASGAATGCAPQLTASNALSKSPNSVAWVAPDGVLYGSSESILYLDGTHDQIRWTYRPTMFGDTPISLMTLDRAGGTPVVGVGYNVHGGSNVDTLAVLDLKDGSQLKWWDITSSTGMIYLGGSVPAMDRDPVDGTRVAYGDSSHPARQVALPWDGSSVQPTVWYRTQPPNGRQTTFHTIVTGSLKRAVWNQSGTTGIDDTIYEIDDDGSGAQPQIYGPLKCTTASLCASPFRSSDAAPDPTTAQRALATCDTSTSNVKNVVRIDNAGCTLVVDGSKLPVQTFPFALAVGNSR